jgi:RNA polymerase sigma-70 factor (ECF subfamily)
MREAAGVSADLLAKARAGDGEAFAQLVGPYRRELQVHCYRILGSVQDAEDAAQEALLSAWQAFAAFEGRASMKTWLYRIATNRCLKSLRSASRRPQPSQNQPDRVLPEPTRYGEVLWLEPYPDVLLEGLAGTPPGPEARYEAREAISLAFVTAVQLLPPRQRAVLILRDVLGFRAAEVAEMLEVSHESVTSALKRARATLVREHTAHEAPPLPRSAAEQKLADRLARVFESSDVQGLVSLLTDDAWVRMPPLPFEYQGRALAAQFFTLGFRDGRKFRLIPTRANGQPAFGLYIREPQTEIAHANGLLVLSLAGDQISAITRFDPGVFPHFGLPRTIPGQRP